MARSYRHISMYEKEILELKNQGLTHKEIGLRYSLTKEQIKEFIKRHKMNHTTGLYCLCLKTRYMIV